MKILVFGDSYCADTNEGSWINWLKIDYNTEVECYGQDGVGQFYIYNNMIKHQIDHIKNADHVIVLCTSPDRLYNDSFYQSPNYFHSHASLKDTNLTTEAKNIYQAYTWYYKYLHSDSLSDFIHKHTVDDIKKLIGQKCQLIPCFHKSLPMYHGFCLYDIVLRQLKEIKQSGLPEKNTLKNHMTPENQRILAKHIWQIITTGQSTVCLDDFFIIPKEMQNFYYSK